MFYKVPVKVEPLCNLSNFDGAANFQDKFDSAAYFEKVKINLSDKRYIKRCLKKIMGLT